MQHFSYIRSTCLFKVSRICLSSSSGASVGPWAGWGRLWRPRRTLSWGLSGSWQSTQGTWRHRSTCRGSDPRARASCTHPRGRRRLTTHCRARTWAAVMVDWPLVLSCLTVSGLSLKSTLVATRRMGVLGQWCSSSAAQRWRTFSKEEGADTEKHSRKTSCTIKHTSRAENKEKLLQLFIHLHAFET